MHYLTFFSTALAVMASIASTTALKIDHSLLPDHALLSSRASDDPSDFGWIKRWAAIGDSFTAGIGSGTANYPNKNSWHCSRYNQAYPAVLNELFGPTVESFQYPACSGDKSFDIWQQAIELEGNLDFVVLTAGGNDMCLSKVIEKCIFFGILLTDEHTCDLYIEEALNNLNTFLKDNLKAVIGALSGKVRDDGIVVFNKYAEYFNEQDGDCNHECWYLISLTEAVRLDKARRQTFNSMVRDINALIQEVVDEANEDPAINFKVVTSDWNAWVKDAVDGQYCDPKSTGLYPDNMVPELQFFKPRTTCDISELKKEKRSLLVEGASDHTSGSVDGGSDENKPDTIPLVSILSTDAQDLRREAQKEVRGSYIYNKNLWESSRDPAKMVLGRLDPRQSPEPIIPSCNGSAPPPPTAHDELRRRFPIPDGLGKMFHPNEKGHLTIATFVAAHLMDFRAEQVGGSNPVCAVVDQFKCWREDDFKGYVKFKLVYDAKDEFCDNQPTDQDNAGWTAKKTYHAGTPEQVTFVVRADNSITSGLNRDQCHESFKRILDGCDGNDPDNPLNWKSGGKWVRGGLTYEVNPDRSNRPWPPPKETGGLCMGKTVGLFVFDKYVIRGRGWSTWDHGKDTLLPAIKSCVGLGVTSWNFEYLGGPDWDNNEWQATFNTPAFTKARCFDNNKVQFRADGFSDGCHYEKTIG